jgi:hypothetical protein
MKSFSAAVMVIFLGMLAGGAMLPAAAVMKYVDRDKADFREREGMGDLLDGMVRRFEELAAEESDGRDHPVLEEIRSDYAAYGLSIKDISSGLNLNFLPDADLSDPAMAAFLFSGGNAGAFLSRRKITGFEQSMEGWKTFLTEEGFSAAVCYGWFSTAHIGQETFVRLSSGREEGELFPLVNDLALINVNTADPSLFAPLLSRASWRIPQAARKAEALVKRLEGGRVSAGELRSLLGLSGEHELFRYLGVKTAFWALRFEKGKYVMDAVVAAVPGAVRGEGSRGIVERYRLIEGRLHRD